MLLLELNEFNRDLLRAIADRDSLPALQQVQSWSATQLQTQDTYDSGFLEPWVQWVSIHTGAPSREHQIKNLGDVPALGLEQVWQRWSRCGDAAVVWGVMNGDRRAARTCKVFIPDPWTFTEAPYPSTYDGLIELPRYLAKNYLDVSKTKCAAEAFRLLRTLISRMDRRDFIDGLSILLEGLRLFGTKHIVFIVTFEYLSAMAFLRALKEVQPDKAIVFLNMFAHAQHHYWKNPDGNDCLELSYAAKAIDRILQKILDRASDFKCADRITITNGLSQKCTHDEDPWILHRPKNPLKLLNHIGLHPARVEPLMTHDAHVSFDTVEEAENAFHLLSNARINGKSMFHVEKNWDYETMIFYRLDYFDPVDDESEFIHGNSRSRFKDHFISVVQRTGKHIQDGVIYANWDGLPQKMMNHQLNAYL